MHDTRRTRLVLAALLIAALALITIDARNSSAGPVRGLRSLGGLVFGSAESVHSSAVPCVSAQWRYIVSIRSIKMSSRPWAMNALRSGVMAW